jgi:ribosomal protein S19
MVTLKIHKKMVGYKFGEFLYTRQKFSYKKK